MARHFGVPPNNGRPCRDDRRLHIVNTEAPLDRAGKRWLDDEPEAMGRAAGCLRIVIGTVLAFGVAIVCLIMLINAVFARDDGRYANSPLKTWFDQLGSGRGMCCSFADGRTVEDPDWGADAHGYWVVVDGHRLSVPPDAVVTVPNKFGPAVVWPYQDGDGKTQIRCFLPGAGA